jgi:hypothetical protein
VREKSVLFGLGALGLVLQSAPTKHGGHSGSMVADFQPLEDGSQGPAQLSGMISEGDIVSKINGEGVTDISNEAVMRKLIARPAVVHFIGFHELAHEQEQGGGQGGESVLSGDLQL